MKKIKNRKNYFGILIFNYKILKILSYSTIILFSLLILDIFNIPTLVLSKIGYVCVVLVFLFFLFKLIDLKILELFKLNTVNFLDYWFTIFLISSLSYSIITATMKDFSGNAFYQHPISIIFSCIIICALIFRYIYITFLSQKIIKQSNVYDLRDLYEGNIISKGIPIYLEEKEVDYDLLKRDRIINQLKNAIEHCYVDDKFVISLKGDWGSGKTTIIKNVQNILKNNEELIFIDDFNPWAFENNVSLFRGMFDSIINKIGYSFSITEINRFLKTYLNIISKNTKFKLDSLSYDNSSSELIKIKEIINSYLVANNKRIVFIIDNIERANSENILFIINLISNLFDFKRIIYILSYDERVMQDKFKNLQIKYEYLEKIIQMEISVPTINQYEINNVVNVSFKNLLNSYSEDIKNEEDYNKVLKILSSQIVSIRDLKRVINSTFIISFNKENYLNKLDTLLLETLSLKNKELIEEIYSNKEFYISEDYHIYSNKYLYNSEQYNKDATSYFKELFQNFTTKKYEEILSYLFPNVKKYFQDYHLLEYGHNRIEFRNEHPYISETRQLEYEECVKNKRIYNGKFFDLYFTKDRNEFIEIDEKVRNFIHVVNNGNLNDIVNEYNNLLLLYTNFVQKYTLETLEYYLDSIKNNKLALLYIMYDSINHTDNSALFFQLNANERNLIIISDLINMITDEELLTFINKIEHDYKNLKNIKSIRYWLEPKNRTKKNSSQERYEIFNNMFEGLKNEIVSKKINLYDYKYYNRYNIIFFEENEEYVKYIKRKINVDNILLFLADMISMSNGTNGFGYELDKNRMKKIISIKKAERLLKEAKDETGLKDIVLKAFYPPENVWKENTYYTNNYIDLNKLTILYIIENKND